MDVTAQLDWPSMLLNPMGHRSNKPRVNGKTMVIDKGLGLHAFEDLLQSSGEYIDIVKLGFGTSPLYPPKLLRRKIEIAKEHLVNIMPGGTFLEVAVHQHTIPAYFEMIRNFGFTGVEVSDGTIEMERQLRNELILRGLEAGLNVCTEYGKKSWGSTIELEALLDTIHMDLEFGAETVIIEGRESGMGVGIYDEQGRCDDDQVRNMLDHITNPNTIMWEAPLKTQQVHFLKMLGSDINLGNIAPEEIMSVESLRRGLRSDTLTMARRHVR